MTLSFEPRFMAKFAPSCSSASVGFCPRDRMRGPSSRVEMQPGWDGRSSSLKWWPEGIPSGKHTKNYGKIHHFLWENSLFLWPCSIFVYPQVICYIAMDNHHVLWENPLFLWAIFNSKRLVITRGYISQFMDFWWIFRLCHPSQFRKA